MKNRCKTGGWEFEETSTQIWRRITKAMAPVCASCQRIARAEKAAEKRTIRKNRTVDKTEYSTCKDNLLVQLKLAKEKFGHVSTTFIQRKHHVTFEEAEKLAEKING